MRKIMRAHNRIIQPSLDSTGGWVDSIRQVDVDLNFLLVPYSTVGLYRLVCLFGRLDICWEIFLGGQNTLAAHPML